VSRTSVAAIDAPNRRINPSRERLAKVAPGASARLAIDEMKYTVAADALAKIECDGKEGHAGAKPRTVIEARPDARRDERPDEGGSDWIGSDWLGLDWIRTRLVAREPRPNDRTTTTRRRGAECDDGVTDERRRRRGRLTRAIDARRTRFSKPRRRASFDTPRRWWRARGRNGR